MNGSGRSPKLGGARHTPALLAALLVACGQAPLTSPVAAPAAEKATPTTPPAPPARSRTPEARDATPTPSAGPAALRWLSGATLIVFSSRRRGTGNSFDIFFYDVGAETVFAPPGLNTPGDELDASLSSDGRYVVYASDYPDGDFDLRLYDLQREIENPLTAINSPADELSPSITDDGNVIAYLLDEGGVGRLRLADLRTQSPYRVPVAPRLDVSVLNPTISGDGAWVAFAAVMPAGDTDIQLYDVRGARLLTPPFINTPSNEADPDLSADGRALLFVTDRRGSRDIFLADWAAGNVDPLPLANSEATDEDPSFRGEDGILFNTTRDGSSRFALYNRRSATLDTLPVMHEPGAEDL